MPANKYALIRYRVIDRLITNKYRTYPSIEELIEGCSEAIGKVVSKSTIEKDIYAMKNDAALGFEAPIAFSKSHGGYHYTDPEYTIKDVPLTDEEVQAIQFAARTLFQFKGIGIFEQYEAAIDKILDRIQVNAANPKAQELIQFEQLPTTRGNEYLILLLQAIRNGKRVQFFYKSYKKGAGKVRIVAPYLLKEYSHRWYLIGFSDEHNRVVVFGLDRIEDLELTADSFKIDADFNPAQFFKYSLGITSLSDEPQEIDIRIDDILKQYLDSQPIHASQKITGTPGNWRLNLYLCVSYELIEKVLSFGDQAVVVGPALLKEQVSSRLKRALDQYS